MPPPLFRYMNCGNVRSETALKFYCDYYWAAIGKSFCHSSIQIGMILRGRVEVKNSDEGQQQWLLNIIQPAVANTCSPACTTSCQDEAFPLCRLPYDESQFSLRSISNTDGRRIIYKAWRCSQQTLEFTPPQHLTTHTRTRTQTSLPAAAAVPAAKLYVKYVASNNNCPADRLHSQLSRAKHTLTSSAANGRGGWLAGSSCLLASLPP